MYADTKYKKERPQYQFVRIYLNSTTLQRDIIVVTYFKNILRTNKAQPNFEIIFEKWPSLWFVGVAVVCNGNHVVLEF